MSHIVSIATQVKDIVAVRAACHRMKLVEPLVDTARLYGGEVSGLVVQLPGWKYPIVIDPASGTVRFDNFNGAWKQ